MPKILARFLVVLICSCLVFGSGGASVLPHSSAAIPTLPIPLIQAQAVIAPLSTARFLGPRTFHRAFTTLVLLTVAAIPGLHDQRGYAAQDPAPRLVNTSKAIVPAALKLHQARKDVEERLEAANQEWEARLTPILETSLLDAALTPSQQKYVQKNGLTPEQRMYLLKVRMATDDHLVTDEATKTAHDAVEKIVQEARGILRQEYLLLGLRYSVYAGEGVNPVSDDEWKAVREVLGAEDLEKRMARTFPAPLSMGEWNPVLKEGGCVIFIMPSPDPSGKIAFLQHTRVWNPERTRVADTLQHSLGTWDGKLVHPVKPRTHTALTWRGERFTPMAYGKDPDFPKPEPKPKPNKEKKRKSKDPTGSSAAGTIAPLWRPFGVSPTLWESA
jgi:hypothetical protein